MWDPNEAPLSQRQAPLRHFPFDLDCHDQIFPLQQQQGRGAQNPQRNAAATELISFINLSGTPSAWVQKDRQSPSSLLRFFLNQGPGRKKFSKASLGTALAFEE